MQIIDGTDLVLGRASSQIAKKLLQGEQVQLLNAEKMIIRGEPQNILEKYKTRRAVQHKGTPEFSPVWSKVPHLLVRRIIRGMLPWKRARGKQALKLLRVFTGTPPNLTPTLSLDNAKFNKKGRFITLYQLCRQLGFNG